MSGFGKYSGSLVRLLGWDVDEGLLIRLRFGIFSFNGFSCYTHSYSGLRESSVVAGYIQSSQSQLLYIRLDVSAGARLSWVKPRSDIQVSPLISIEDFISLISNYFRTLFCERFICPKTVIAGKYISLYRKIRDQGHYVHLSNSNSSKLKASGSGKLNGSMAVAKKQ